MAEKCPICGGDVKMSSTYDKKKNKVIKQLECTKCGGYNQLEDSAKLGRRLKYAAKKLDEFRKKAQDIIQKNLDKADTKQKIADGLKKTAQEVGELLKPRRK